MEEKQIKEKTNYFTLIVLILVVIAMVTSFFKYYLNLDYDTLLAIECDPTTDICFYDEESYYQKLLVYTKILDDNCFDSSSDDCVLDLKDKGLARVVECNEDNLEKWEICTNPYDYIEEDVEEMVEEVVEDSIIEE